MTSQDDSRDNKTPAGSHVSGKRPHATLDLTAVEIKDPVPRKVASQSTDTARDASPKSASDDAATASSRTATAGQSGQSNPAGDEATMHDKSGTKSNQGSTSAKSAPPTNPPPPIVKRRGRFLGPLMGGIVGGALALFGGDYMLQRLGIPKLAGTTTQSMDAIEAQLADLDAQLSSISVQSGTGSDSNPQTLSTIASHQQKIDALSNTTDSLVAKQATLEEQVATLSKQTPAMESEAIVEFQKKLADLEQRIDNEGVSTSSGTTTEPVPQITALSQKLSQLERAVADQSKAQSGNGLSEDADTRVKTALAAATTAQADTTRLDGEFGAIKSTTNRLDKRVEALQTSSDQLSESIKILNETSLKMSSEITTLRTKLQNELGAVARPADINAAVTPYRDRVANLEANLKALEKVEVERAEQAKNVVLSLELANLQRAINSGQPFADELTRVKATTRDQADLGQLESYAGQGVPTLATLQDTFRPLIHQILRASSPDQETSFFDQVVDRAKSVVRVRKVAHDKNDTSVEAIVARIEESLKIGKLTAVVEHATALPAANKAPIQPWLDQVKARTSVDNAMANLQSNLKMALSKTTLTRGR